METSSKGTGPSEFATSLASHGLDPKGAVHWNLGWEELHEIAVKRGEATLTSHGVLLATTGELVVHLMTDLLLKSQDLQMMFGGVR